MARELNLLARNQSDVRSLINPTSQGDGWAILNVLNITHNGTSVNSIISGNSEVVHVSIPNYIESGEVGLNSCGKN